MGRAFDQRLDDWAADDFTTSRKSKALRAAGRIVANDEEQVNFLDIQLQLSKLEKAAVMRIACSSKHALIVTNTGSVFSWGENEFG